MSQQNDNPVVYPGGVPNQPHMYPCPVHPPMNEPSYFPTSQLQFARPGAPSQVPQTNQQQNIANVPGMLPIEQSYIENILRLNKGKIVTVYMTFENNEQWNAKVFHGRIEAAGRDHLIISEPTTGKRFLLLMVYLDYVEFDEEINYEYPFGTNVGTTISQYPPR